MVSMTLLSSLPVVHRIRTSASSVSSPLDTDSFAVSSESCIASLVCVYRRWHTGLNDEFFSTLPEVGCGHLQRLGHSASSTTTDIYAQVLTGMGKLAAETLERVMQG